MKEKVFLYMGLAGLAAVPFLVSLFLQTRQDVPLVPIQLPVLEESRASASDVSLPETERIPVSQDPVLSIGMTDALSYQAQMSLLQETNAELEERVQSLERELQQIRWSLTENSPYVAFLNSKESEKLSDKEKAYVHNVLARFPVYLETGEAFALRDLTEECFAPGKDCDDLIIQILGAKRLVKDLGEQFLREELCDKHVALLGLLPGEK